MDTSQTTQLITKIEDKNKEEHNKLVLSYMALRNLVGYAGLLLPLALMLLTKESNGKFSENSISDYYYTRNGDILVVLMSVLGIFLFTYKGYGKDWKERALTLIAAICALGVAFSPTRGMPVQNKEVQEISIHTHIAFGGESIHLLCAATFFIASTFTLIYYFPMSDLTKDELKDRPAQKIQKIKRNKVFKICGWVILACIAILAIYMLLKEAGIFKTNFPVIFAFETVAVIAFGIAWLTKGQTLLPDDGESYTMKVVKNAVRRKTYKP